MSIKQSDYETLLSEYSSPEGAIALLKEYRLYLEMLPSIRRPSESLITIPLPILRIRNSSCLQAMHLPCDLAILMCDPEWKIKMGVEILVFIQKPQEDFSDLLSRWRKTQVCLDGDYEWLMPENAQHMFSEAAEKIHPLFVIFDRSLERVKKGLAGACLPFVVHKSQLAINDETIDLFASQDLD